MQAWYWQSATFLSTQTGKNRTSAGFEPDEQVVTTAVATSNVDYTANETNGEHMFNYNRQEQQSERDVNPSPNNHASTQVSHEAATIGSGHHSIRATNPAVASGSALLTRNDDTTHHHRHGQHLLQSLRYNDDRHVSCKEQNSNQQASVLESPAKGGDNGQVSFSDFAQYAQTNRPADQNDLAMHLVGTNSNVPTADAQPMDDEIGNQAEPTGVLDGHDHNKKRPQKRDETKAERKERKRLKKEKRRLKEERKQERGRSRERSTSKGKKNRRQSSSQKEPPAALSTHQPSQQPQQSPPPQQTLLQPWVPRTSSATSGDEGKLQSISYIQANPNRP